MFCRTCVSFLQKSNILWFAFTWLAGLVAGGFIAMQTHFSVFSLMLAAHSGVSIVRLLLIAIIPYAITIILYLVFTKHFIYPLSAIKGFTYAYCSLLILMFPNCGWLLKSLLLFTASVSVVILNWMWIRILCNKIKINEMILCAFIICSVCIFDYFCIIPFSISLFNH